MENIKVRASFILPGRVLPAEKSISKTDENQQDNYTTETIKMGKKFGTITINLRKAKPITQVLNLTLEAYNYLTSNEAVIGGKFTAREWAKLTKHKKLKYHLIDMAQDLHGTLGDFVVLES